MQLHKLDGIAKLMFCGIVIIFSSPAASCIIKLQSEKFYQDSRVLFSHPGFPEESFEHLSIKHHVTTRDI